MTEIYNDEHNPARRGHSPGRRHTDHDAGPQGGGNITIQSGCTVHIHNDSRSATDDLRAKITALEARIAGIEGQARDEGDSTSVDRAN